MPRRHLLAAALLSLLACDGPAVVPDGGPTGTLDDNFGVTEDQGREGCDNLLPDCLWPYPSDVYEEGDHLALPDPLLPPRRATFSPEVTNRMHGFGAATPIVFQLPGAVLPTDRAVFDAAPSLEPGSPTIVLDAATGELIPHWLETDYLSPDLDPPALVIRPAIPLPRGARIVVGVRGLTDAAGAVVDAPEGFAALRDRTASRWIGVHARRARFDADVFPALEAAGVARDELQLAWTFSVQTDADATAPLLAVRDAILGALPAEGPAYTIDAIYVCDGGGDDPAECHPSIRVIVDGTVSVPSVMEPPDALGVRVVRRDAAGAPVVMGFEEHPFRLQLPNAAFDGDAPVPVLQYGHGFLGRRAEANNDWLRRMADRLGFAILACDMQGMSEDIASVWTDVVLMEGGRFPDLQQLAWQGVLNQLVQQRMVKTSLAADADPRLRRADGQLAWDPTTVWYYGNSQGGSVGTVVLALSVDVTRGVLGVPGSGYPFLLHRSVDFSPFVDIITITYRSNDALPLFLAVLGTGWDPFDPLTFSPHLHGDPLPGTPDHEVLFHVAKEDRQVQNQASFISGRAAGATLMTPAIRPVFLLPETPYPASPGAALVEVDFGIPDDPTPLDPPDGDPAQPDGGDTHGWLRQYPPAQDQMIHFLRTGEVIDVCGGACVSDGRP
ncbi:MAG: hypothetical protein H6719_25755 [Sandaracinaceae bacterium]|nr:hypothetical protein [Sandaracinaceae bacterium]